MASSVSVVLPVYAGAPVEPLRVAMQSLADQTRQADEILVVEDGRLLHTHDEILRWFMGSIPIRRVQLPVQRGVAAALQAGLEAARGSWIARMDADDIALPTRFAIQLAELEAQEHDVLGTAMYEFTSDPEDTTAVREMPVTHEHIARFMTRANAINHPTVVFRRARAIEVGGYRPPNGLEDYDLWVRLLLAGARFHNLVDPLVRFRADHAMYARRRSLTVVRAEATLQRRFVDYGFVTRRRALSNLVARTAYRTLPEPLMRRANATLFGRAG